MSAWSAQTVRLIERRPSEIPFLSLDGTWLRPVALIFRVDPKAGNMGPFGRWRLPRYCIPEILFGRYQTIRFRMRLRPRSDKLIWFRIFELYKLSLDAESW